MRKCLQTVLLMLIFTSLAFAQNPIVRVEWLPPTEDANGEPLSGLAHYVINYGQTSRGTETDPTVFIYPFETPDIPHPTFQAEITLDQLGIWYLSAQACDGNGNCSLYSNEVSFEVLQSYFPDNIAPSAPINLTVQLIFTDPTAPINQSPIQGLIINNQSSSHSLLALSLPVQPYSDDNSRELTEVPPYLQTSSLLQTTFADASLAATTSYISWTANVDQSVYICWDVRHPEPSWLLNNFSVPLSADILGRINTNDLCLIYERFYQADDIVELFGGGLPSGGLQYVVFITT